MSGDHFGAYGDPPSIDEIRTKEAIQNLQEKRKHHKYARCKHCRRQVVYRTESKREYQIIGIGADAEPMLGDLMDDGVDAAYYYCYTCGVLKQCDISFPKT